MNRPSRLQRPIATKPYRKLFVISTEGEKTEPAYFSIFRNEHVTVKILSTSSKSAPRDALKRLKTYKDIKKDDQLWLVIDKDNWTDQQLQELSDWVLKKQEQRGLAVSVPKFEYWLLLHFQEARHLSPQQCSDALLRHLPNYKKNHLEVQKLRSGVRLAIQRAQKKDTPPCENWPNQCGSTVYRLVEKILNVSDSTKRN